MISVVVISNKLLSLNNFVAIAGYVIVSAFPLGLIKTVKFQANPMPV